MGRLLWMIAYLDTQIAIWLVNGQLRKLSKAALQNIERCSLLLSPMVLLELEYLYEIKRASQRSARALDTLQADLGVELCNLSFSAVAQAAVHETWTRDVFDRLIVAHARANGVASLVSADERIRANYSATIW